MGGVYIRKRWWPRKFLADLDVILRTPGACLGHTLEENVARWDRTHDELTGDTLALGMTLDLANMLPKWMGDENQRILLAYETVFGQRAEAIGKTITETAHAILNEQARQRRLDRE